MFFVATFLLATFLVLALAFLVAFLGAVAFATILVFVALGAVALATILLALALFASATEFVPLRAGAATSELARKAAQMRKTSVFFIVNPLKFSVESLDKYRWCYASKFRSKCQGGFGKFFEISLKFGGNLGFYWIFLEILDFVLEILDFVGIRHSEPSAASAKNLGNSRLAREFPHRYRACGALRLLAWMFEAFGSAWF